MKNFKIYCSIAATLIVVFFSGFAFAQSAPSNPAMTYGMVPTVGQWNNWFQQKQDTLGFTPVNRAGDTMLGPLKTTGSTASNAGFSILTGIAPNVPNNGDIWLTSSGLYYQAGNITFGPIGAGTITGPGSTTVGNVAKWGNTSGTSLVDGGALGTAATQNTGTSGANVPLLNGVNTWSGAQTIPTLNINGAAGAGTRVQHFQTSGVDRFVFGLDNGSESGSNAGSNAFFNSYSDAGGFLSTVWSVTRSTGVMNISNLTLSNPLPVGSGGTGIASLGSGVATWLGTPSSANLASAITDETGSGFLVFGTSPNLTTPNLGTPSAATLTNATGLPLTTGVTGTLGITNGGTGATTAVNARTNLGLTAAATATASVGGSWTPVLAFGGGSTGITYSTQSGTWQRIGPFIYVSFTITLTSKGSSTGAATIGGLPIAASSGGSLLIVAGSNFVTQSPTFGVIAAGTTSASIGVAGSTGPVALTDTNFSATTSLTMSGIYTNGAF